MLEILKKIYSKNHNKTFEEIIKIFKNEMSKIDKIEDNYSNIIKDGINVEIECGQELINKMEKEYKQNKKNFCFNDFITNEKKKLNEHINKKVFEIIGINISNVSNSSSSNNTLFEKLKSYGNNSKSLEKYLKTLNKVETQKYTEKLEEIEKYNEMNYIKPDYLNVLDRNINYKNKSVILPMITDYENMVNSDSEKYKYKRWINKILKVPFETYVNTDVNSISSKKKINKYLKNIKNKMDSDIYGHVE